MSLPIKSARKRKGMGLVFVRRWSSGMTLVTTLLLMIPLVVVGLAFVTLSSVTVRMSLMNSPTEAAQANARIALDLALSELQRQAGLDTRITARADILNDVNPPVLGVWRSWEGTDHETSGTFAGRPISPGADYRTAKESRFLAWLTSANESDPTILPNTASGPGKVTLVGPGSVGTGRQASEIHLTPTMIESDGASASFAWWISGENQKARLPKPYQPVTSNQMRLKAGWANMAKSHAVADPKPFRLEPLLEDPTAAENILSLSQADILASPSYLKASREFYHDLSAVSVGLLTNSATGGWRKDMSLLSETWESQSVSNLPMFRLRPEPVVNTQAAFATFTNVFATGSLFYPWANYSTATQLQQPVASWSNLMDFVSFYKRGSGDNSITTSSTGVRSATAWAWDSTLSMSDYRHLHKVRLYPVVARIQWVFSHFAVRAGTDPANPGSYLYTPKLLMTPVVTMWNPYNLEMTVPHALQFQVKVIPVALSYQIGGILNTSYNCVLNVNNFTRPTTNTPSLLAYDGGPGMYNTFRFPATMVLKPGEAKVFSPADNDRKIPNGVGGPWGVSHTLDLLPGYRGSGGHIYPVRNQSGIATARSANTSIKAHVSFDTEYSSMWGTNGVGTDLEVTAPPDKYMQWIRTGYSGSIARALHPPLGGNDVMQISNLQQLESSPVPFCSTIYGPKIATTVGNTFNEQYASKGLVQSTLFGHFPPLTYRKPNQSPNPYYQYSGTGHPINYGFEYSYAAHTGMDDNLPNSGSDGSGYIISGGQSGNGLPRAVIAELPSRPLASLGELNHWDLRFENPCPPFGFNLVGNSDASPLLPANAVVNPSEAGKVDNFRHDDTFCANHLLFDDWFFSTITDDPRDFGNRILRTRQRVFGEFVTGTTALANASYKPLLEDQAAATATLEGASNLYLTHVNPIRSWQTIASRLEVEGMFNVNSTSVAAWRALLGHARNQRIPYIQHGASWSIGLSEEKDHVVSRSTIAGDDEAGSPLVGAFPEATEFTGYRTLDDAFIDELAQEIVRQVRLRGPFLSLAEFVNRQLSENKELAVAGAIQAALNSLTTGGSAENPLATVQSLSNPSVANVPQGAAAEDQTGYVFPEAAEGYNTYGVPGWTRQSDILRPLAPILSARDDTFTIRAYGDTRDAAGTVLATAVCEVVVRRTRNYVDPVDSADITTAPTSETNKTYGRKFEIVSFRWLRARDI